ncbi:hypothetical protein B0H66DRAFT_621379 [Apodospora peruviana]|uniref:tyrosinase n=1 Tax=Apodospora peruviana TaxID=516989 RepID=A0AAE0I3J3_9PEZI|nr:hypothetical protein B0H66DRAFT_621379 [Apodospora peruviana]
MAPTPIPVIGLGTGSVAGSVPERKEVRDLAKDPILFELFLLGLLKFQQQDATEPTSFWGLASIHGEPYEAWNGVDRPFMGKKVNPDSNRGGYCAHSSNLFGTWHRPYIALFEQELNKHVQSEAKRLGLSDKARDFRLPYWDFGKKVASDRDRFPDLFFVKKVKLDNTEPGREIDNPLGAFTIDPRGTVAQKNPNIFIPGGRAADSVRQYTGRTTFRYPLRGTETSQNGSIGARLNNQLPPDQLNALLLADLGFNAFTTDKFAPRQKLRTYVSLEGVHNNIHGLVGGNGHMAFPESAAFDTIFWLHHCNVDRLFAIYQALNPARYVESVQASGWAVNNFTTDSGDIQDGNTKLYPFWNNKGTDIWTSNGIKKTDDLGYVYPETSLKARQQPGYKDWLQVRISQLYPLPSGLRLASAPTASVANISSFTMAQPKPEFSSLAAQSVPELKSVHAVHKTTANTPGKHDTPVANTAPTTSGASTSASIMTTTAAAPKAAPVAGAGASAHPTVSTTEPHDESDAFNLWTVDIRTEKHALGEPYSVYVFLGDFPADASQWDLNPTTTGSVFVFGQSTETKCDKCVDDMAENLLVTGTVSLTGALVKDVQDGKLGSLEAADVVPYLTSQLHWRVAKTDCTEVPRDQVPGLVVCVSSVKVHIGSNGVPVYEHEHELYREITDGRPAGMGLQETP